MRFPPAKAGLSRDLCLLNIFTRRSPHNVRSRRIGNLQHACYHLFISPAATCANHATSTYASYLLSYTDARHRVLRNCCPAHVRVSAVDAARTCWYANNIYIPRGAHNRYLSAATLWRTAARGNGRVSLRLRERSMSLCRRGICLFFHQNCHVTAYSGARADNSTIFITAAV